MQCMPVSALLHMPTVLLYVITGGKGAHGAADAVGGAIANDVVDALRRYGTSYLYGVLAPESAMKVRLLAEAVQQLT